MYPVSDILSQDTIKEESERDLDSRRVSAADDQEDVITREKTLYNFFHYMVYGNESDEEVEVVRQDRPRESRLNPYDETLREDRNSPVFSDPEIPRATSNNGVVLSKEEGEETLSHSFSSWGGEYSSSDAATSPRRAESSISKPVESVSAPRITSLINLADTESGSGLNPQKHAYISEGADPVSALISTRESDMSEGTGHAILRAAAKGLPRETSAGISFREYAEQASRTDSQSGDSEPVTPADPSEEELGGLTTVLSPKSEAVIKDPLRIRDHETLECTPIKSECASPVSKKLRIFQIFSPNMEDSSGCDHCAVCGHRAGPKPGSTRRTSV